LASPPLEVSTWSQEDLAQKTSLLSCQARVWLCRDNSNDMGEDVSSSFEEALQLNVLVSHYDYPLAIPTSEILTSNRTWCVELSATLILRLLPSTDPKLARLGLLRRVDTLSVSSDGHSNLSESADLFSTQANTSTSSEIVSTNHVQEAGREKQGIQIVHTRAQESVHIANDSFFVTADAEGQSQQGAVSRILLTDNAGDINDFFDIAFTTANESQASTEGDDLICRTDNHYGVQSGYSFSAQPFEEVEMVRRQGALFAARLSLS
jgi:hypothetical protein